MILDQRNPDWGFGLSDDSSISEIDFFWCIDRCQESVTSVQWFDSRDSSPASTGGISVYRKRKPNPMPGLRIASKTLSRPDSSSNGLTGSPVLPSLNSIIEFEILSTDLDRSPSSFFMQSTYQSVPIPDLVGKIDQISRKQPILFDLIKNILVLRSSNAIPRKKNSSDPTGNDWTRLALAACAIHPINLNDRKILPNLLTQSGQPPTQSCLKKNATPKFPGLFLFSSKRAKHMLREVGSLGNKLIDSISENCKRSE